MRVSRKYCAGTRPTIDSPSLARSSWKRIRYLLPFILGCKESAMASVSSSSRRRLLWLLREPLVHFFFIGALLFGAQHWLLGDSRAITVTPGLRAELRRRFQDLNGRTPNPAELAQSLAQWERDEALFREALREHLERDDPAVRSALIDKMHARAALEVPKREPTTAELDAWLAAHRS